MRLTYFNNIILALVALTTAYSFYCDARGIRVKRNEPGKEYYILLGLLVVAGIFLRVFEFGEIPGGFNQDGAMAAVDGKALSDYMTDRFGTFMPAHLYGWGFGQMSSLLSYLIAIPVGFFGLSPVTARLPQLLVSIMGGVCFFLFIRETCGKRAGFVAMLFLVINPWHLLQSRWALDCNLFPHFVMAGVYFLYRGLRGKQWWLYGSMVFFGLSMYGYGVSIYSVPLLLIMGCVYALVTKKVKPLQALICAGVYLLIAWPFILTMAVNFFGWDTIKLPFVTMQHFTSSMRAKDILFFSDNIPKQLRQNFRFLLDILLQKDDLLWNTLPGFGTMFAFAVPLMIAGIVKLVRDEKGTGRVLTVIFLITGIAVCLFTNNVNVNRANLIMYPMMMLSVLGICYIAERVKYSYEGFVCLIVAAGILLSVAYFEIYNDELKHDFYDGFGEALISAENTGADVIFVTADTQYEGSGAVSEILTLFYDRTDALYYQGKTNIDHGRELLPYSQRFVYVSMDPSIALRAGGNAAFVIRQEDAGLFSGYQVRYFGDYAMAVRDPSAVIDGQ